MRDRARAEALIARWGCAPDGEPFKTEASLLWPVRRRGAALMLKMADPDDDEAEAAAVLLALDGRGAVRLVEREGAATLMERVEPGGPSLIAMAVAGRDDEATRVLGRVVATMHGALAGAQVPTLIPFERRADALRRILREGTAPPEAREGFERAAELIDRLVRETRGAWVPLHGDVHHGNVLHDARRGWLAIDPKGILGPRATDYANLLFNPLEIGPDGPPAALIARRVALLERMGGPGGRELLLWAWVHAQIATAWSLGHPEWLRRGLACAKAVETLGAPGTAG